jgi:hypothetical protein
MDARIVKEGVRELSRYVPFKSPSTGWYYSKEKPRVSITFDDDTWTCMFKHIERLFLGERLCFSAQHTGCKYAAFYLGFEKPGTGEGAFLGTQARTKKTAEFGIEHYASIQVPPPQEDYLVLERIADIDDNATIDVVNLWIDALSLTGLVTMANFDNPKNDGAVVPYAAGCQSIWTIPYKETFQASPGAVVGAMDPVVRGYMPADVLSFSVPANRLIEMCQDIPDSFLKLEQWTKLVME